jgi:ribonuclease VapC
MGRGIVRIVLDSSAILAMVYAEKGADLVEDHISHSVMSTVNVAEIASLMIEKGFTINDTKDLLNSLKIEVIPFDEDQAFIAAGLREKTRSRGLSLGDRACLALALVRELPVLTADRAWDSLDIGVDIKLIR